MYRIAVMGSRDSIYGFASVGLDIYPVEDMQSAAKQLKALAEGVYGIIYVTEELYMCLEKELAVYEKRLLPAVIPIPGASGNTGLGLRRVRKSVEKAVGSDIIFGKT